MHIQMPRFGNVYKHVDTKEAKQHEAELHRQGIKTAVGFPDELTDKHRWVIYTDESGTKDLTNYKLAEQRRRKNIQG